MHANYAGLLLPDFFLIFLGYCICRWTSLDAPTWKSVEKIVYYVFFPVLLFQSIVNHPIQWHAEAKLMAAGATLGCIAIMAAYSLAYIPYLRQQFSTQDHAASAQVAFRFNALIGLAIAERLAGPHGIAQMAVLIGICVPIFNIAAVWPMAKTSPNGLLHELIRNPLIVGTISGLLASTLGLELPSWTQSTLQRMGSTTLVLGLMATGAGLKIALLRYNKALSVSVLTIKHAMLPICAMAICKVFALNPSQATVLITFSALPTASSCYVLAARMGYNASYVAGLISLSTLLALISLPMALYFLHG